MGFFLHAKSDLRVLVRSRGLEDVYKGQTEGSEFKEKRVLHIVIFEGEELRIDAVSNTHLTLPTIYSV